MALSKVERPLKIGLIVDNPNRDLAGAALLAHALAKRGAEAVIVPFYQQAVDIPLLGLDVLLLNYARLNNKPLMQTYNRLGIALVVLDTEGGILSESGMNAPANWARLIKDSGLGAMIDAYLFWGETVCQAFRDGSGLAPDSLHATGCPRFDITAPKWRDLLTYSRAGYVLVNANFPSVNPRYSGSVEKEKATLRGVGWESAYVEKLFAELERTFKAYLGELRRLAEALPERDFLLRPHPFEKPETYTQALGDLGNVTIDPGGNVLNVIHHARCVLHLNCGTSVEAIQLGKLPVSLEYLNSETLRSHSRLPSQVSHAAESFADLCAAIEKADSLTASFDFEGLHRQFIQPWFHLPDGAAAERVADVLFELAQRQKTTGPAQRVSLAASLAAGREAAPAGQRLQAAVMNLLGSRAGTALRSHMSPLRRQKQVSSAALAELLAGFAAADGASAPPRVAAARHPLHGLPLASLRVIPARTQAREGRAA